MKQKKELTPRQERHIRYRRIVALLLAVLVGISAYHYLTEYYPAKDNACNVINEGKRNGTILASSQNENNLIFKADAETDTGILFYPGGKVDYIAYAPLLEKLRQEGYDVVLIKMPFNLAFFNMNVADEVITDMKYDLPEVEHWYILGHSLGGVAASKYAADFPKEVEGLMLLGSYDYGGYDPANTLIIYGSNDLNLDLSKIDFEQSEVYCIQGGNHAWFGDYGMQEGDGKATLTHEEQQTQTVDKIQEWINNK